MGSNPIRGINQLNWESLPSGYRKFMSEIKGITNIELKVENESVIEFIHYIASEFGIIKGCKCEFFPIKKEEIQLIDEKNNNKHRKYYICPDCRDEVV